MRAYEECPRFDVCAVNKCPLDQLYKERASVPGEFLTMPALAYEMYFPQVWGRSDGATFSIAE